MTIRDMRMSTRLISGFTVMGALIVLLGTVSFIKVRGIGAEFDSVMKDHYPKLRSCLR